jgi:fructoselysine 6-kinase
MSAAVCVGDNCIDNYLPPVNRRYVGGNAVNVAVSLCQAGIPAAYVGVVGNDDEGELTLQALRGQAVDVTRTRILPGQTARTDIQLDHSGERQFVHEYLGPQPALDLDEDALQFICSHDLVHNTLTGGSEAYLPRFHDPGSRIVSMDYGERSRPEFIARTLAYVDWAFFSMDADSRAEAEKLARSASSKGPSLIVVTLGTGGSIAYDGREHHQPATEAAMVVDTLGAGDAYLGSFLAARLRGLGIAACMERASKVAAQACGHFGAWEQSEQQRAAES